MKIQVSFGYTDPVPKLYTHARAHMSVPSHFSLQCPESSPEPHQTPELGFSNTTSSQSSQMGLQPGHSLGPFQ